jgi:hypothetical protein
MTKRGWIVLTALASLSLGGYLALAARVAGPGFPLDDAWIHQTYARNLIQYGEWSFIPGTPSGGSTAPLWSALLAPAHALGLAPFTWTFALGALLLIALAWCGHWALQVFEPGRLRWAWVAAIVLLFEWHLVWAAGSGMETLLMATVTTALLIWIAARPGAYLAKGALIGLSIWIRPDGLTLLGPLLFAAYFAGGGPGARLRSGLRSLIGFGLGFVPYLGFNLVVAGQIWPNTFFAKQAEYAVLRDLFLGQRVLDQALLPLVGVGIVLLPGVLMFALRQYRSRNWSVLAGLIWFGGNVLMYALRLPVTYQHGRYLIPSMPIFFIWGTAGLAGFVRPAARSMGIRILSRAWPLAAGLTLLLFWFQGAQAYSQDVGVINSAMVATAAWLDEHTEPQALIAAHDIGAIGYFAGRDLIDMAGLVSPEVIPFIRDEALLAQHLDGRKADYFVTLEGWYPALEAGADVIFRSDSVGPTDFGAIMVVYRWR